MSSLGESGPTIITLALLILILAFIYIISLITAFIGSILLLTSTKKYFKELNTFQKSSILLSTISTFVLSLFVIMLVIAQFFDNDTFVGVVLIFMVLCSIVTTISSILLLSSFKGKFKNLPPFIKTSALLTAIPNFIIPSVSVIIFILLVALGMADLYAGN